MPCTAKRQLASAQNELDNADQTLASQNVLETSTARRLLRYLRACDNSSDWLRASIRRYSYGAKLLENRRWFTDSDDQEQAPLGTTFLGVVLRGTLEVSIVESLGTEREYHRPAAILRKGNLLGTYEAMDLICRSPPLQDYTVFSGIRTFFFADGVFDSYVDDKGRRPFVDCLFQQCQSYNVNSSDSVARKALEQWHRKNFHSNYSPTQGPFLLLTAILGRAGLHAWKSEILLIELGSEFFNRAPREIRDLVATEAWRQSANLRRQAVRSFISDTTIHLLTSRAGDVPPTPAKYRSPIARELLALPALLAEERPGFQLLEAKREGSNPCGVRIEECGPFIQFFESLEKLRTSEAKIGGTNFRQGMTRWGKISCGVYLTSYLYDAPTDLVYPLWPHFNPFCCEDDGKGAGETAYNRGPGVVGTVEARWSQILKSVLGDDASFYGRSIRIETSRKPDEVPCMLRGPILFARNASPDLPLFGSVAEFVGPKVAGLICVQHLMDETVALIAELIRRKVVDADKVWILGKPYSSNGRVCHRLRLLGVRHASIAPGPWAVGQFDQWFAKEAEKFLQQAITGIDPGRETVMLLDDGGALIEAAKGVAKKYRFVGVEQTSRGLKAAFDSVFPVVVVACSALKSIVEPEFVARAVVTKVAQYYPEALSKKNVGVVGLGSLGLYLMRYLTARQDVHVEGKFICWDSDEERRDQATSEGMPVADNIDEVFRVSDVIYGCTGSDLGCIALAGESKPQLLISASSGDVEFSSVLKSTGKLLHPSLERPIIWAPVTVGGLTVAHGGLPITFDGGPVSAPLIEMQFTRTLLLAGLQQAARVELGTKGAISLDPGEQSKVAERWKGMMYPLMWDATVAEAPWIGRRHVEFSQKRTLIDFPSLIVSETSIRSENSRLFEAARRRYGR